MKKIFRTLLLAVLVLLLAACKNETTTKEQDVFTPKLDTTTACKIKVGGEYSNFEALEDEFKRFNAYYPNVELSYTKIDSYHKTIATVLKGKDAPNIFFSYSSWTGNSAYDEVFAQMENLADPELGINLDCIRQGLINRSSDGKVLTVPIFSQTYGMMVNNDLFEKEGLQVPTTLQELLNVCAAFKEKEYKSPIMGFSKKSSGSLMNTVSYPIFAATLAEHPEAVALANSGDSQAGEYMRTALETISQLISSGCIDLEECAKINDDYTQVLLRFFEGDVPMMICTANTVSGREKRENESTAFKEHPFSYTFTTIPTTAKGGYFIDSPLIQFSVNKDCENLAMTNEFMRFLISSTELNQVAAKKCIIGSSKDFSFESYYAPFKDVPQDLIIQPTALGVQDSLAIQIRIAAYQVGTGAITIEEAIQKYGTFE